MRFLQGLRWGRHGRKLLVFLITVCVGLKMGDPSTVGVENKLGP